MAKAISDRDEANAKIEVATAKITTLTAKKNALEDEIDTLNGQIAELKKARWTSRVGVFELWYEF